MTNPVPLGTEELEEYLEKFDERLTNDFCSYLDLVAEVNRLEKSSRTTKRLKKLLTELERFEKSLGIEYNDINTVIVNELKLVSCDDNIFIYKGIDSRGYIEIMDANGDTAYLLDRTIKIIDSVADAKNKELR